MNPPVNRENLRDALIAVVVVTGLAWVVSAFAGCSVNTAPLLPIRPLVATAQQKS